MLLGLDIGVSSLKAGLVDFTGKIVRVEAIPTPGSLVDFQRLADNMLSRLASGLAIDGAGIGCPGVISPADTKVETLPGSLSYLQGVSLSDFVTRWVPADATICADNDARAALAGELMFGAARGRKSALMLALGAGIGGAIAVNGMLVSGHRGAAGQVAHLTVDPDGPPCYCGNRGCLETYFSAGAFEIEASAAVRRGCDSLLTRRFGENPLAITCAEVFACAGDGDTVARAIVERGLKYLGGAIAGLLHVLDSEIVIIGGALATAASPLLEPLRKDVERRTSRFLGRVVPLAAATAGEHAGVIGAAALTLHAARSERIKLGAVPALVS